jgi:hypothetical protein
MTRRLLVLALTGLVVAACGEQGGVEKPNAGRGVEATVRSFLESEELLDADGKVFCAARLYGEDPKSTSKKVAYAVYSCDDWVESDSGLENTQGSIVPAVFHLTRTDSSWKVERMEQAGEGSEYAPSMKKLFPASVRRAIENDDANCKLVEETLTAARSAYDASDAKVIEPDACLDDDPTT